MLKLILAINDDLMESPGDTLVFIAACAALGWLLFEALFPSLH